MIDTKRIEFYYNLALQKIEEFNVSNNGRYQTSVRMIKSMRIMGEAWQHHNQRILSLNVDYVQTASHEDILDTILHEIAHFLAGCHNGHNDVWKAKCLEVGAKPQRCGDGAWEYKKAGKVVRRYGKSK